MPKKAGTVIYNIFINEKFFPYDNALISFNNFDFICEFNGSSRLFERVFKDKSFYNFSFSYCLSKLYFDGIEDK